MRDWEPARWWWLAVTMLVVVGAGGRIWQTQESLWLDELHTSWCASGQLAEVAQRAAMGNQSPLFFWLEWLSMQMLGPHEWSLRLVSVVAGSLLPLALFGVGWRWTGSALVGFVAAVLAVVDPLAIFFATEARPYALVQLLAVLHVGAFAELVLQPTKWLRVMFVGGAAALFFLHYTAALLVIAEILGWCALAALKPQNIRYRASMLAIDCGLIALLCLPAMGQLTRIFARRENWAAFIARRPLSDLLSILAWSAAAVWVLAAVAVDALRGPPRAENNALQPPPLTGNPARVLTLCWLLVPLAIAWLVAATDVSRIFFPRYLAASAPAALLLAAMCVEIAPGRWAKLSLAAALMGTAVWTSGIADQLRTNGRLIGDRQEDWRGAVAWLNQQLAAEPSPVFVASGLIEADGLMQPHDELLEDYCLLPVLGLYHLQIKRSDLIPLTYRDPSHLRPEAQSLFSSHGSAWVIARGRHSTGFRSPGGQWTIRESKKFGTVFVAHLALNPQP